MTRKPSSFPRQTVQVGADHVFMLLEELHALQQHKQLNGDLRKVVAEGWLYLGSMVEQGIVPEGFSDFHRHFIQQAQEMERKKQNPPWTEGDIRRFRSMLWSAADTPALLRPQDVGRVFENAKRKQAQEEHVRQWLLIQPDLMPRTRHVLETGFYEGRKAF